MAVLVELFGAAILENAEAIGESGIVVGGGVLVTGTDCVEASGALLWASGEVESGWQIGIIAGRVIFMQRENFVGEREQEYLYLSRLVTLPGASGAFLRLLLDQFLFAPTFIGVFLSTLMTLEGRPSQIIPKLQQEWFPGVLANWKLWIPFQFLNFRFVPQQFQVLAANFIALVWNVVLSFIAHKEILPK
ncbi:hypothetical protein FH972_019945 [Carpinus fangiana]|uniref:Uncharacterized protein n=1 Tax=Carpinus fangiana TaxID=176857 RepID=A0A5N6RUW8_9ROSI|nr:hypothetical protein FH972_019945 [Carpinus fangiana]